MMIKLTIAMVAVLALAAGLALVLGGHPVLMAGLVGILAFDIGFIAGTWWKGLHSNADGLQTVRAHELSP